MLLQVKADRNNKKLYTVQQASRHVNDMAAVVVTSTKHGQQQISETGERRSRGSASLFNFCNIKPDFSGFMLRLPLGVRRNLKRITNIS